MLTDEDVVDWDDEYPPQTGEEEAHSMYNNDSLRDINNHEYGRTRHFKNTYYTVTAQWLECVGKVNIFG